MQSGSYESAKKEWIRDMKLEKNTVASVFGCDKNFSYDYLENSFNRTGEITCSNANCPNTRKEFVGAALDISNGSEKVNALDEAFEAWSTGSRKNLCRFPYESKPSHEECIESTVANITQYVCSGELEYSHLGFNEVPPILIYKVYVLLYFIFTRVVQLYPMLETGLFVPSSCYVWTTTKYNVMWDITRYNEYTSKGVSYWLFASLGV